MNDKITIVRSFGRKINLGNYESADFFSSHSMDLPADASAEDQSGASDELFTLCKLEVSTAINDYLADRMSVDEKKV